MSDDKITISMDEVSHATPVPSSPPSPIFTSGYVPPESAQEAMPKRTGLFIGIGVAAVALLCIIGIGVMALMSSPYGGLVRERMVSDYRTEAIQEISAELSKPDSKLKKRIEDAHLTVKVTSTEIVGCDVTTLDGSGKAGKAGKADANIDKVSMLIRFRWQGIVDTGYSDLRIVYDVQNKRTLKSEIEYTTAIFNVEDTAFWTDVGALIGAALAL